MDPIVRLGRGPLVVVAPHGGTSDRDLLEPPARPVRSNDLCTAELARHLAERVDGSLLANDALDRNHVDLNRIDEVSSRAPWLFERLAGMVDRAIAAHGRAEVVFVHGWHVVQPRCDVGVGARFEGPADAPLERLTVGPDYLAHRIEALRAACRRIGVDAAFGDRWPGAHSNNVLQVFRRHSERAFDGAAARLAAAARSGAVEAVQLELGAALRWPGPLRDAFVEAFAESLASHDAASGDRSVHGGEERVLPDAPSEHRPFGLRLFDPAAGPSGLGLVAGVGPMPGGRRGGRLLLFPGSQRLVLFTGEQRGGATGSVGALRFEREQGGLRLRFEGPALAAPDGREHFRSERAQLRASVVPVSIDVRLHADEGGFGMVSGRVEIDGDRRTVEAAGFEGVPWGASSGEAHRVETRVAAAPDGRRGLSFRVRGRELAGLRHGGPGSAPEEIRGTALWPGTRPGAFVAEIEGGSLRCEPRCHLSWLRSGSEGRHALVTVGVLACGIDRESTGGGIFEHVEPRSARDRGPDRENTGLPAEVKVP